MQHSNRLLKNLHLYFLLLSLDSVAQDWGTFFSYQNIIDIVPAKDNIYCASANAIFSYNINSKELKEITKINGLSDIGISTIYYDKNTQTLYVGYQNGLLDIISNTYRAVHRDIMQSTYTNKRINKILAYQDKIYLCTNFGIVEYLTASQTFGTTFPVGTKTTQTPVHDMLVSNKHIYITTDEGVKVIDISQNNFSAYNWNTLPKLKGGTPSQIQQIGSDVCVYNDDGIYKYSGSKWVLLKNIKNIKHLMSYDRKILITLLDKVNLYNHSFNLLDQVKTRNNKYYQNAIYHQNNIYIGTKNNGVLCRKNGDEYFIRPNTPIYDSIKSISAKNGVLWIIPTTQDTDNSIGLLEKGSWKYYKLSEVLNLNNIHYINISANKAKDVYLSSASDGLVELKDGKATKKYGKDVFGFSKYNASNIDVGKGIFDKNENYWTLNNFVDNELILRTKNKTWHQFNINPENTKYRLSDIVIDDNNYKWIASKGNGITVYNHGKSVVSSADDKVARLSTQSSKGGLPSNMVNTLAVDKDNKVWIGTAKGLVVFTQHNRNNVFSSKYKADHILIDKEDNLAHKLLSNQKVTKILVDGANRKWIATAHHGAYYLSASGKKMLHHFHKGNSPIPSNEILDMSIDGSTGTVYFCTKVAMASYQNRITQADKNFKKVYAYPNPVTPDYKGKIYIKGLAENSDIKITDISGNLIYETVSRGGQIAWDGNTQDGHRASSGVYLVFATNENGNTAMTKIVIIN